MDSKICSVIMFDGDLLMAARYCNNSLVFSVLPEPLSPLYFNNEWNKQTNKQVRKNKLTPFFLNKCNKPD